MKCKACKSRFEPKNKMHVVCSYVCSIKHVENEKVKAWQIQKKKLKEELKPLSKVLNDTQKVFNIWIRHRDKDNNCISCNKPPKKKNAGHYIHSKKSELLTFHEDNVHLQCERCNTHLHSNAIEYRINLIQKIGIDRVEWLEANRNVVKKHTKSELIDIQNKYKIKIIKK